MFGVYFVPRYIGMAFRNLMDNFPSLQIFRVLDQDGDGIISKGDMKDVVVKLGLDLTSEEMDEMFEEADKDGDRMINFDGI